jgi:hypothetical protein
MIDSHLHLEPLQVRNGSGRKVKSGRTILLPCKGKAVNLFTIEKHVPIVSTIPFDGRCAIVDMHYRSPISI